MRKELRLKMNLIDKIAAREDERKEAIRREVEEVMRRLGENRIRVTVELKKRDGSRGQYGYGPFGSPFFDKEWGPWVKLREDHRQGLKYVPDEEILEEFLEHAEELMDHIIQEMRAATCEGVK